MVDGIALSKSVVVFLYTPLLFFGGSGGFMILSLLESMLFLLPKIQCFRQAWGKYVKLNFVKFISLDINYFVGTGCFRFEEI